MSLFSFFSKIKTDPKAEAQGEQYFRQALQYHQYGNQDDAILFFTKSLEVSPNHSNVYLNRAGCFMIQERYLEAYDDYLQVINMEKERQSVDGVRASPMALQNIERIKLFLSFEKQNGDKIRGQLANDGFEHFTTRWAEVLSDIHLKNDLDAIKHFVYEEIKELADMGGVHLEYALNCGIDHSEFVNVTESATTQQAFVFFKGILCCFSRGPQKMFEIRTTILNKLMKMFNLNNVYNNSPDPHNDIHSLDTIGKQKYLLLKESFKDKEVLDAIYENLLGNPQVSLRLHSEVKQAVSCLNYLHSLTGLNGAELIEAVQKIDDRNFICKINKAETLKSKNN